MHQQCTQRCAPEAGALRGYSLPTVQGRGEYCHERERMIHVGRRKTRVQASRAAVYSTCFRKFICQKSAVLGAEAVNIVTASTGIVSQCFRLRLRYSQAASKLSTKTLEVSGNAHTSSSAGADTVSSPAKYAGSPAIVFSCTVSSG